MNYRVNFRYTKENSEEEKFFASYIVDAESGGYGIDEMKGEELLAKEYPDFKPEEYDLDTEWKI